MEGRRGRRILARVRGLPSMMEVEVEVEVELDLEVDVEVGFQCSMIQCRAVLC